jgi:UPF0755 protein
VNAKKSKGSSHKTIWLSVIIILCIMAMTVIFTLYEDLLASNVNKQSKSPRYIYYSERFTIDENFERIEQSGVLKKTQSLRRLAKWLSYEDVLRSGRYILDGNLNNIQILRLLVSGTQTPLDITFKYAERPDDLAVFWAKQLDIDTLELKNMILDAAFVDSINLTKAQSVCIFIPNTYNMYWDTQADELIARMVKEYKKFWNESRLERAKILNLTPGEIMTLASIVQKETAKPDEMPIVAGVYYNRLNRGMLLQADPTVIFAMNDKSIRRVGGTMLQVVSPYNTYKNKGLPPGPICIPNQLTIDAVLNMHKHSFIYFCAREDFSGYHSFASNFAQHAINARKYQRALNKRGIKRQ